MNKKVVLVVVAVAAICAYLFLAKKPEVTVEASVVAESSSAASVEAAPAVEASSSAASVEATAPVTK